MYLVVGLGNPEEKYAKTFHNMGFLAVEDLAVLLGVKFNKLQCKALTAEARINGEKVIIAKPQTYMNLSGDSVSELVKYYKIPPENLLVIYDDADLEKGSLRLRPNGSAGTHNGMRNIIERLGCENFPRIRVGIHDKESQMPLINYVLSEVKKEDYPLFIQTLNNAAKAAMEYVSGSDFDSVMQKYNLRVK